MKQTHGSGKNDQCEWCGADGCHWTRHAEAVREVRAEQSPKSDEATWSPVGSR